MTIDLQIVFQIIIRNDHIMWSYTFEFRANIKLPTERDGVVRKRIHEKCIGKLKFSMKHVPKRAARRKTVIE